MNKPRRNAPRAGARSKRGERTPGATRDGVSLRRTREEKTASKPKKRAPHIRRATAADRREWARLRRALWPDCRGPRARLEMRELLGDPGQFGVLVLDDGAGRLSGFIELALRAGVDGAAREITAFVEGWYVEPGLRGRGWGRRLVAAARAWARARGMRELASDAELWNEAALHAHRACGFRETFRVVQFLQRV